MALRFLDGFAHYVTTNVYQKWTEVDGAPAIHTNSGPLGGPSLSMGPSEGLAKTIDHQSGYTFSYKFMTTANSFFANVWTAMRHVDTNLIRVKLEGDATFSVFAGNGVTLIGNSSPVSIHGNTWYRFELKADFSGTATITCTATLKLNGTPIVTGTAATGLAASQLLLQTPTVNNLFFSPNGAGQTYYADLYMNDPTGTLNTGFNGDCTIVAVYPDGDVATGWNTFGGTGTAHWTLINEHPPDDDTTYVYAGSSNTFDNYDWQDITTFSGTILGVQYSVYARKDDEGVRTIKQTVGDGGTEASTPEIFLGDSYVFYTYPLDADPATGSRWTQSGFNAKRFGFIVGTATNT